MNCILVEEKGCKLIPYNDFMIEKELGTQSLEYSLRDSEYKAICNEEVESPTYINKVSKISRASFRGPVILYKESYVTKEELREMSNLLFGEEYVY